MLDEVILAAIQIVHEMINILRMIELIGNGGKINFLREKIKILFSSLMKLSLMTYKDSIIFLYFKNHIFNFENKIIRNC